MLSLPPGGRMAIPAVKVEDFHSKMADSLYFCDCQPLFAVYILLYNLVMS